MKVAHAPILLVVVCGCAGAPTPPPQVAAPASAVASAGTTDPGARCAVWDRENEFARSVHDHDASVFAEHVLPGAVFVNGSGLFQGREAIVKGWDKIIKGDGMPYSLPVSDDGTWVVLASSSEPPLRVVLEILWSRISARFGEAPDMFGDDGERASQYRLLDYRVFEGGVGWATSPW